ncbi:MAG: class I SAM-dependent methyltransferase [Spirochaetaceae bacterium]|nr:MAG: class I SAM-dependent methyltransferase [Spirochaetaceae bacterium]
MRDQVDGVRRYYNRNTSWMLLFGQGRGEAVIHRPVWMAEKSSRREALHTIERLIADTLVIEDPTGRSDKQILDLGCGVGGSALWLAEHYGARVTGITVSPVQVQTAQQLAVRCGLSDRCRFQVADFNQLPEIKGITGAYAIESFSHGDEPRAFFSQVNRMLPIGGRLVVCDDFLSSDQSAPTVQREIWLSRFREGWHLRTLLRADQVLRIAAELGFQLIDSKNLTPYLKQTPLLFSLLQRLMGSTLRRTAWGSSMYGSSALQICQKNGWTEYLFLALEKR